MPTIYPPSHPEWWARYALPHLKIPNGSAGQSNERSHPDPRLLHRVRAGLAGDGILVTGGAAATDRADDLATLDQRNPRRETPSAAANPA